MANRKKTLVDNPKPIEQYEHKDKERLNNPPVGLVDAHTDNGGLKKKKYQYDPHLDPQLQWAGKAEHTSFEVPIVSLHVHERIDPRRVIETVRKEEKGQFYQPSLFEEFKRPLREAIEFYKHKENWSNRLIAGDSLLVMNSLLEKEALGGKVQMVYFDPPYGIKYGSNFQPFVNKRDVKDGKDEDLTAEPEMIKAFRDTWELGIHSYLTYLRDRLLLVRDLLNESGSIFVQISDENLHHVRELLDEVFCVQNFCVVICYRRLGTMIGVELKSSSHYLLWYAKDKTKYKFRKIFEEQIAGIGTGDHFTQLENDTTNDCRPMTRDERTNPNNIPIGWKPFQLVSLQTHGVGSTNKFEININGQFYLPGANKAWRTTENGIKNLIKNNRLQQAGNTIRYKQFLGDFPYTEVGSIWTNAARDPENLYVVQTPTNIISRCLHMTTDPGDLVLDITCGSGTTAYVAEKWGRRWITCDTSRVAIALAKQRLMTANFDYFELAHANEGVGSGFKYKTVPHITLKSIANNEPAPRETLYDQPLIDAKRLRVTGPFTIEAVPAPTTKTFAEVESEGLQQADTSVARSGETLRQSEWRDELLRTGVRAKGGKSIEFTRVEPLSGTHYLQAEAETKEADPKRVLVCFGPEHAPLEQRTVELALEEAQHLKPNAQIILFCAFQFDDEAAKDIDETNWPGLTLLKAQMNADLLTDDLKKKRSSNESFWLIGQPDVVIKESEEKGKYIVEVLGFDYYNPRTGAIESGGKNDIAMWMLDTDYDGRSLFPSQIFFPMAGEKEGWATLAKNLKAVIDEEKIEAFKGTVSLPFTPGKAAAVKIIDARGIESLKILRGEFSK
ncbi:MAG: adenine-specific DNA-methyltransferase [Acidobacteriota bacterium]|nr:adenine-specific DNA-methyltransferase [Acidobacteriota bacterium]